MSAQSNYRGILVDSGQYRAISNVVEFKHVVHFNPPKETQAYATFLDKVWFRLGHRSIPTFVVTQRPHPILTELCKAGLLYDMRGLHVPESPGGMYDLMHEILSGRATFIARCNEIRDVLASRERIRWCGAEMESIFNAQVYRNATEICGNAILSFYCSLQTGAEGRLPSHMSESHLRNMYRDILEKFGEDGQRKLGLIMYAIPRCGYNIVYVGGSPGDAWLYSISQRDFDGVIVSIDPQPLSTSAYMKCKVVEIRAVVESPDDIPILLERGGVGDIRDIIFVWDVRHADARSMSESERLSCIAGEVALLNAICNSPWFRNNVKVYQLKVNASSLDLYELPADTRLYAQPFTLTRDVYELRATGHISTPNFPLAVISPESQASIREYSRTLKERLTSGEIDDYSLFINFLCSIYRQCDYIESPPLVPPEWEIALFTLNWNAPAKLSRYFDRIYHSSVKFIGSFFTGPRLTSGEYVFPEHLLLSRYPSMVFDSRAIISAKLEGLYFFANVVDCRCMENELIFSESYLIGSTEYNLHSLGRMDHYDAVRTKECERVNAVFPKFPNAFSAADHIISPSGHALRMFIEYTQNAASLCMFAHKILSNFYRTGASRITKEYVGTLFQTDDASWLSSLNPNFIPRKSRLERAEDSIWHSREEWIVGYLSGHEIAQSRSEELSELVDP